MNQSLLQSEKTFLLIFWEQILVSLDTVLLNINYFLTVTAHLLFSYQKLNYF